MAGEWLKIESSLPEKPEVFKIARILGIEADAVIGKLLRLWGWFDSNSVDGCVDGCVDADIDRVSKCSGFANALEKVGWLKVDAEKETVTLPNFTRHNGETAKQRALKNKRQANWRANVDGNASTQASTKASTREEKRREEKKEAITETVPVSKLCTFESWIKTIPEDADAIPLDHHVFAYADSVKLPRDFLALEWVYFEKYYTTGNGKAKKYKSWPDHFRTAVESGYGKLWGIGTDGSYYLTTAGKQLQLEVQS